MNPFRRVISLLRRREPGVIGTPPSARQVLAGPGLHAVDFAHPYAEPMNYLVENRMMELGIDPKRIGSGDVNYGIRHPACGLPPPRHDRRKQRRWRQAGC